MATNVGLSSTTCQTSGSSIHTLIANKTHIALSVLRQRQLCILRSAFFWVLVQLNYENLVKTTTHMVLLFFMGSAFLAVYRGIVHFYGFRVFAKINEMGKIPNSKDSPKIDSYSAREVVMS